MEPGRVEHLTKAEIGYLAGMVDFCGTFYISEEVKERRPTPQHDLQIVVSSFDRTLLDYWRAKTGLGSVHPVGEGFQWRFSAMTAQTLLYLVDGQLRNARTLARARVARDFRQTFVEGRRYLDQETIQRRRYLRQVMMEL